MNGAVDVAQEIQNQIALVKVKFQHALDAGDHPRAQNLNDQLASLHRLLHEVK